MKLALKVIPNAKKSEAVGWEEDPRAGRALKLRIAAPPVEGKANKVVVLFLSAWLDIPRSSISLLRGESSRLKVVELPDGCEVRKAGRKAGIFFMRRRVASGAVHYASNVIHVLAGR